MKETTKETMKEATNEPTIINLMYFPHNTLPVAIY